MPLVAVLERLAATALAAALLCACSGESAENGAAPHESPDDADPLSYETSPILAATLNGHGTWMLSLAKPTPVLHNSLPDVTEIAPSPSRRSVFQSINDNGFITGSLFALEPNARVLASLPVGGSRLLGWTADDVLLYVTSTGLLRVSSDGASQEEIPFPVERFSGGGYISLSPDGSEAVFTDMPPEAPGIQLVDTTTGALLKRWPVSNSGPLYWAADGHIALTPYNGKSIDIATRDGMAFTTHPLPFQPCKIVGRVDPSLLEVWERTGDPATNTVCNVQWLVRTDGTLVGPDTEGPPAAFSPDRKKLLLLETNLTVTDLDRQNPIELPHIDQIWGPIVW
ncbi:MAG TPA: hypothetical protein VF103_04275 [Polyangiaceae bacterium]